MLLNDARNRIPLLVVPPVDGAAGAERGMMRMIITEGDTTLYVCTTSSKLSSVLTVEPGVDANDAIVYTSTTPGDDTASRTSVAHIDPAANDAVLSVVMTGKAIVVNLATDGGGTITSTAADVAAAVMAATGLVYAVAEGTGLGLADAAAEADLVGGTDSGSSVWTTK